MFKYQKTTSDGENIGAPEVMSLRSLRARLSLVCPRMPLEKMEHFIALAHAGKGGPVDVTHFERGALVFSVRLWCIEPSSL